MLSSGTWSQYISLGVHELLSTTRGCSIFFLKQVVKLKPWEQKAPTLILKTYSYAVRIRILWIKAAFPSLPLIWLCLLSKLSKRVKKKKKLKGGVERGLLCVSFVFPISDLSLPTPWRPKPRVRCSFEIYSFLGGIVVWRACFLVSLRWAECFSQWILMNGFTEEGCLSWQFVFPMCLCSSVSNNFCFVTKVTF